MLAGTMFSLLAQPFDLMSVNASDKVAQSSFFAVTNNSINMFEPTSLTKPSLTVNGDTMVVARVQKSTTTVQEQGRIVNNFALDQNYPNPFNMSTVIRYSLPEQANVMIKVFDVTGREIATVVNDSKSAGVYSVGFGNMQLSSGTYFYRMIAQAPNGKTTIETKKMIVMK